MKKSILIVSPYFPYPLTGGGHQALFNEIDALRSDYKIILACPIALPQNVSELKSIWGDVDICIMSYESKNRKTSIIKTLKRLITFNSVNDNSIFYLEEIFLNDFFNILFNFKERWVNFINQTIQDTRCDIIQFEFYPFLNSISFISTNSLKIFVHHEIGFVKLTRSLYLTDFSDIFKNSMTNKLKFLETDYLNQYDRIITLSETDRQFLLDAGVEKEIFCSPFPLKSIFIKNEIQFSFNSRLVIIGGESNYPNLDGLQWFIKDIWPLIFKEYKNMELHVLGNWSKQTRKRLSLSGIVFTGFVTDIKEYIQNSVSVVPIRIGSGIRVKIIESIMMGIPVVSTSIGAEGLEIIENEIFIADSPIQFLEAIQGIKRSEKLISNWLYKARIKISDYYSKENFIKMREEIFNQ